MIAPEKYAQIFLCLMENVVYVGMMIPRRQIFDYLLWSGYRRSEKWRLFFERRVTFLGVLMIVMFVIGTFWGTDVINNALGFISCFCGMLVLVDLASIIVRRKNVEVSNLPSKTFHVGERGTVSFTVKALRRVKRTRLTVYPSGLDQSFQRFLRTREPGEKRRNAFDKTLKYYRWRYLCNQRGFDCEGYDLPIMEKGTEHTASIELHCLERGAWSLVDTRTKLVGILGLFERSRKTIGKRTTFFIAPQIVPVRLPEMTGAGRAEEAMLETYPRKGESLEFLSIRDYQVGDSWRRVNWKGVARTDKMMVQEYEAYAVPRYTITVDLKGMDRGEVEVALCAACSMVQTLSDAGEVGQVTIYHGSGVKSFDWVDQRALLLLEMATIDYDNPWDALAEEGEEASGFIYLIALDGSRECSELLQVSGECVNGIPIKEGVRL